MVFSRFVARFGAPAMAALSAAVSIVLGAGNIIISLGLTCGLWLLMLLTYHELAWPRSIPLSRRSIVLAAVLLVTIWAIQIGSIPGPR